MYGPWPRTTRRAPAVETSRSGTPGCATDHAVTASTAPGSSAARQAFAEVGDQSVDGDALLDHRVAITDRDGVVVERVEIDGDAVRRPDLVLTAVPTSDRLRLVVLAHPAALEQVEDLARGRGERVLLRQRQHGHLVGRQTRVELEDDAFLELTVGVRCLFDAVRVEEERQRGARGTRGRLDHVRVVAAVVRLVVVGEILTGSLL